MVIRYLGLPPQQGTGENPALPRLPCSLGEGHPSVGLNSPSRSGDLPPSLGPEGISRRALRRGQAKDGARGTIPGTSAGDLGELGAGCGQRMGGKSRGTQVSPSITGVPSQKRLTPVLYAQGAGALVQSKVPRGTGHGAARERGLAVVVGSIQMLTPPSVS